MEPIKCPKCGCDQLSANKKGFGLGKAIVGGVILGPAGALGGFVGSRKVQITCISCGHQWGAGDKKLSTSTKPSERYTVEGQKPEEIGCLGWLLIFVPVVAFLLYQAKKAGCF